MLLLRSVVDDRHLHAAIRVALRAHGFAVAQDAYTQTVAAQWECGCWLRDQMLPEQFPAFVDVDEYRAIAHHDPYLWQRLAWMAGLGYQQTCALSRAAALSPDQGAAAALVGAAFNTGIAVLDYLVDESETGVSLFELLPTELIHELCAPTGDAAARLATTYAQVNDPRLRVLCALIATCERGFRALYQRSGNDTAWHDLAQSLGRLYESERAVSLGGFRSVEQARSQGPLIEAKSVLPSVAMWQLSALALPHAGQESHHAYQASVILGRLFCWIDDLVDLPIDCRRGTPSMALLRLADLLAAAGRSWASDTDLYDLIDAAASEVVALLRTLRGLPTDQQEAPRLQIDHDPGAADRLRDSDPAHLATFAACMVAGWVNWFEDQPDTPTLPRQPLQGGRRGSTAIRPATDLLLAQQRLGYPEAIHNLRFPRGTISTVRYETHAALLFQRAIVLDGLLDAQAAGYTIPEQVMSAEALTILRAKHRDVRGGWSYIPEVPELPPDADDLGMVLQVLVRIGGSALAATCDEAIRLALDATAADGGFPTWIFDLRGSSSLQQIMRTYLGVIGGSGVHPDVVANLVYGLLLYNPVRYQAPLMRSVRYFEAVQDPGGMWPSKWYAGPFYGTYRVATVLGWLTPKSTALKRTQRFLLERQHDCGGWGVHDTDPLSTALALLALAAAGLPRDHAAITRGGDYLGRTQEGDGGWAAQPFIAFPTTDGVEIYASRTITTAFCLKALLATT
ncbi:MAG TPA: hypothetical protein VFZ66_15525 [Herpetosiphonaceae bacterium]